MQEREETLLKVDHLVKQFPVKQTLFEIVGRRPVKYVRAVDDVSFGVRRGETVGLVGESGCGKSTLAKTVCRLYAPDGGHVLFGGADVFAMDKNALRDARYKMQMVFQDPYSSLNPRMTVRQMFYEVLSVHKLCARKDREQEGAGSGGTGSQRAGPLSQPVFRRSAAAHQHRPRADHAA